MPSDPELLSHFQIVVEWDWSNVERLKSAIDYINASGNSLYRNLMQSSLQDLANRTAVRVNLPVHSKPIIAVDVHGRALTGTVEHLEIEMLPYDPSNDR